MKIYIIRHGETDYNRLRLLQGKSDIDLNENGRKAARETAEGMKNIPFDLVFTSPLKRAKETAQIIAGKRDIPFVEDERIMEISFGEFEGKPWRKTEDFPGVENIYHFFNEPDQYQPVKGAESIPHLAQRTAEFMQDICSRKDLEEKTILVSTHGAACRGLLNSLREWKLADFWENGVAPNCGVAIIESRNGHPVLLEQNKVYYHMTEVLKFN